MTHKESFVSTFTYPDHADFFRRAKIIPEQEEKPFDRLKLTREIIRFAKQTRALILDSSAHQDILAAILIGFLEKSRRPVIIMAGDMWQKDDGFAGMLQKIVLRVAYKSIVRYAPVSTEEFPFFLRHGAYPRTS